MSFESEFPKAFSAIGDGVAQGMHTGAQLYISRDREILADFGFHLDTDNILLWLSAGKPITAIAVGQVCEKDLLDIDDPVIRYIPEFAGGGKDGITIRHLLTHTCGIRWADFSMADEWETIIGRICSMRLEPRWIVGETAGYHPITSWYMLAEILRRNDRTGRSFQQIVDEEIFQPLEMCECRFTLDESEYDRLKPRLAKLKNTSDQHGRAIELDDPRYGHLLVPGAGARGPIKMLGRFYESLLFDEKLLSRKTIAKMNSRQRVGKFDLTFKRTIDWGLGFICNSAKYREEIIPYGFGPHASDDAFGHGGSQSSIGMADPTHGLVIAAVFDGMPGEIAHQQRMRGLLKAIYEDLGLARS